MNSIGDTLTSEWAHIRHPHQNHPDQPQETAVTNRIAEAQAAIVHAQAQLAAIPANALAEAIAEAGVAASFSPMQVQIAVDLITSLERSFHAQVQALSPQQLQPQQPV